MTSAEELLEQLKSAGSMDALLRPSTRSKLGAMLDRCAWVRTFDAEVFDILREGDPDVAFQEVIESPDVRSVTGREGVYRLRSQAREAALARLAPGGEVPQELRTLSGRLANHFQDHRRPRDELYQLIITEPPKAIKLLRDLYAKADASFDAPACQALLDLV